MAWRERCGFQRTPVGEAFQGPRRNRDGRRRASHSIDRRNARMVRAQPWARRGGRYDRATMVMVPVMVPPSVVVHRAVIPGPATVIARATPAAWTANVQSKSERWTVDAVVAEGYVIRVVRAEVAIVGVSRCGIGFTGVVAARAGPIRLNQGIPGGAAGQRGHARPKRREARKAAPCARSRCSSHGTPPLRQVPC